MKKSHLRAFEELQTVLGKPCWKVVKSSGDPTLEATMKDNDFLKGSMHACNVPQEGTLTTRFGVHQRDKVSH